MSLYHAIYVIPGSVGSTGPVGSTGNAPDSQVAINFGRGYKRITVPSDYAMYQGHNVLVGGAAVPVTGAQYARYMANCEDQLSGVAAVQAQQSAQLSAIAGNVVAIKTAVGA